MNNQIKKEDIICFDNLKRDVQLLKTTIYLLRFLNFITFGLIEDRFIFQIDKLIDIWKKDMDHKDYFTKKNIK